MFSSIAKASRSLRTGFRAEHGDTFGSALKVDNYNTKIKRQPQLRKETNTKVLKHILHCKFRKNNTFLTLTNVEVDMNYEHNHPEKSFNEKVLYYLTLPERVILSQSTGYLGFRKAQRGEYEAAFQLTSHIFKIIRERNILDDCFNLEIVVSDFGKGRKAFFDALKGKEGSSVRPALSKLTDMTKLKFGGVRSPSRRRI
ncbi:hypothetical protein BRETT_000989 [Brettanomyces bruxellensis]|uniref:Small ribosomal subunit protein uS11m n=1 Tax=Dekkera bruxellensis TaxID=5007 RepID=A0A871RBV6_DEKBR|nr:uncharacterized protein BRETT_000989 [Brettanomyces bruxellensis]QOU21268.1 hypothetical protein BRETT_000989 [Brettanomyces bruxellensis]